MTFTDISTKIRLNSDHLLLFLHGLGCSKASFEEAFNSEGLSQYGICTLDFLGHGESARSADLSYDLESQAAAAKRVLDEIAPKKVTIVAHSMGGAVGLLLAKQIDNLNVFINVEGNLVGGDCGLVSRNLANQSLEDFKAKGRDDFLSLLTSSDRADFHAWAQWYSQADPRAIHECARSMVEWSDSGELIKIFNNLENKVYIYGDEEPKDYLLPLFEDVDTIHIPGLQHFMMIENPTVFYKALSDCLKKYS